MSRCSTLLHLAFLALWASDLRAQAISYVGDIPLPSDHDFVLPLNGRNTGQTHMRVMTVSALYRWVDASNGYLIEVGQFPGALKINRATLVSLGNEAGAPDSTLRVLGVRNALYAYSTWDNAFSSVNVGVGLGSSSMMAYGNSTTMALATSASTDRFFVFNPTNGFTTEMGIGLVTNPSGTAFGTDGLLYVLDHPDGAYRVQSFDVTGELPDADRLKSSFSIGASLSSGYFGMAINSAGHLLIADGLGGGTAYDVAGDHLGDFTFTNDGSAYDSGRGGAPYLNVDDAGNIFVYTPDTGLHHYFDTSYSAIPEPAPLSATLALCGLGFAAWHRRRK